MADRIMFIHGAWLTPLCWDNWVQFFSARGYGCIAPPWPFHEWSVQVLRADPPAGLPRLGVADIVDKYAARIRIEKTPPILIGHSFGGLFVQLLLDRGLGAAGIAIDPAAPCGVSPLRFSSIKATAPFIFTWRHGYDRPCLREQGQSQEVCQGGSGNRLQGVPRPLSLDDRAARLGRGGRICGPVARAARRRRRIRSSECRRRPVRTPRS